MNKQSFTKETFWSLLSKEQGIVIPIIQRSYTQGGRGNDETIEKKGKVFLKYVIDALCSGAKVELDFIYGTVEDDKIMPLDGQQRLTTLFLLHWYIAQKENSLDGVKDILKKFTYQTRVSSRYFCRNLCDFKAPADNESLLSQTIENQHWFVLSWKNDPSVSSMLRMIDKIHDRLKDYEKSLWDALVSTPDTAPATFFYTPLESFNLTDELYIKMNARGKELTPFEKLKASIEQKIDSEEWDKEKSPDKTFGNQMDNEWTDLFWRLRSPVKNGKGQSIGYQIDKSIMRFLSAVLVGCFAGEDKDKGEDKEKGEYREKAERLFNFPESVSPDDFDKKSYDLLYETFNLFYSAENVLGNSTINNADFWWGDTRIKPQTLNDFFKIFIAYDSDKPMTWQQQALFYGFSLHLRNNAALNSAQLADWLCFVRNIITYGKIDSYADFTAAKRRLEEFAQVSGDVYSYITMPKSGFALDQMKEEAQKAKIYMNSPEAKQLIQEIENCSFCRGHAGFVFECLDIKDSVSDIVSLRKMKDIFFAHLDGNDISNDFRRALLTVGDYYTFFQTWAHIPEWYIGYALIGKPQYCLITPLNKEKDKADIRGFATSEERSYLKTLLTGILNSEREPRQIIEQFVVPQDMPSWKKMLIKENAWLDNQNPGYLIIDGDRAFLRNRKKSWYPTEIKTGEDST
jgi:hypothetical protein